MPAPLRPETTVMPGAERGRRPARRSGSCAGAGAWTRIDAPQTLSRIGISRYRKPLPSAAWISPGRSGRDELEQHVARLHALQAVAQEVRVEADLQRLARERHRERLRASPMSGVRADTVSSPS